MIQAKLMRFLRQFLGRRFPDIPEPKSIMVRAFVAIKEASTDLMYIC